MVPSNVKYLQIRICLKIRTNELKKCSDSNHFLKIILNIIVYIMHYLYNSLRSNSTGLYQ